MLQRLGKEKPVILLSLVLGALMLYSCKTDGSTQSEEETAYLADFDPPAYKWGFIDYAGKLAIKSIYDDVGAFSEGMAAVNIGGKWGYIDHQGIMVIKPQFKSAWAFHNSLARVESFEGASRYTDKHGNLLSSKEWSAADDFVEGLARVHVGNSFGYIDTAGRLVILGIYTRGWNFQGGRAIVEYEDHLGVITSAGDAIIPFQYDHIKINQEGTVFLCRQDGNSLAFDLNGKELARLVDARMTDTNGRLVSIKKSESMFFFDLNDKSLKSNEAYSNIIYLGKNRWAGKKEQGYFLLDAEGKKLSANQYTQLNHFKEGRAAYSRKDYWGYLDLDGNELTGDTFGLAWDFKEGLARAAFKDGIAFIDLEQKLAFYPPEGAMDIRDFSEGLAPIQLAR